MTTERLPIVILDLDGDLVLFYADLERHEYRAVEEAGLSFFEDEINAPMSRVIEHSAVTVH